MIAPAPSPACFTEGTLIDTPDGRVCVERLSEGQVVLTASGERVTVEGVWRRHVVIGASSTSLLPIRVKANAIASNVPREDLLVSRDHALFIEGVFVPAAYLVNGRTVTVEEVVQVTYYHVECERHVVLLANGAPAESYLDVGNRSFFSNSEGVSDLHPQIDIEALRQKLAAPWGKPAQVQAIHRELAARAEIVSNIEANTSELAAAVRSVA